MLLGITILLFLPSISSWSHPFLALSYPSAHTAHCTDGRIPDSPSTVKKWTIPRHREKEETRHRFFISNCTSRLSTHFSPLSSIHHGDNALPDSNLDSSCVAHKCLSNPQQSIQFPLQRRLTFFQESLNPDMSSTILCANWLRGVIGESQGRTGRRPYRSMPCGSLTPHRMDQSCQEPADEGLPRRRSKKSQNVVLVLWCDGNGPDGNLRRGRSWCKYLHHWSLHRRLGISCLSGRVE